ncbi:MAG: aldo/keto reductase [Deltaproteobacteria bacterium]|jgi:aryl-alcohol dehydrogenase-like predicted oxidoreductase|nr:aldo/keto reductase [Deltaproteobacteria bacterium]MBT4262668.1 aldo/keto reductase [Deltaproteobacteria bacterium]MBT4643213.1 aldo/keto reductase [Deltaproteobacteria bacterium]MBT6503752.1 aldo/keto reductase [Deltaproteobacteria bacterium]MBT6611682.1 aldo/keto reductase [Deltaproteobacteria bacterium]
MIKRRIGNSDLNVFPIGLGAMGMSEFYGESDDEQSIRTLHKALELGVDFIDTADMYGTGHNEQLLARALKGRIKEITLATKFGIVREPEGKTVGLSGKPDYVKKACEASLKRLETDVIDLYYLHRVDPETPIEDTVGAMGELVKEGKVRYIGLSEVSGDTLKRAHAVHPITAVQSEYSIWTRDNEDANLAVCRELGVSTVAYSPLGRGYLTGTLATITDEKDYRASVPRTSGENLEINLKTVRTIEQMAAAKGVKSSQIALAWLLAQGEDIIPIPGTRREVYLIENIKAVDVALSKSELAELNKIAALVQGTRYSAAAMQSTLR